MLWILGILGRFSIVVVWLAKDSRVLFLGFPYRFFLSVCCLENRVIVWDLGLFRVAL
jgi:hypothetical protein